MAMKRKEFLVRIFIGFRGILVKLDIFPFGKHKKSKFKNKNCHWKGLNLHKNLNLKVKKMLKERKVKKSLLKNNPQQRLMDKVMNKNKAKRKNSIFMHINGQIQLTSRIFPNGSLN